jgi:hypothetical protein
MSANLAMSDDLSRANAMDRPIVGLSRVPSDPIVPIAASRGHFASQGSNDV